MNALDQYIENIDELARKLSPSERKHLLQKIGREIRKNNKTRIAANVAPSGAPFLARQSLESKPLRALGKEQDFLYRGKIHRYRTMKDYGAYWIGWDYKTRTTIKAMKDQIRQPAGGIRAQKMFRKIHQYKYLKLKATSHEAAIGFLGGLVGYIANAHQYGEDNRPERQLVGFSNEDLALIEQMLYAHFSA